VAGEFLSYDLLRAKLTVVADPLMSRAIFDTGWYPSLAATNWSGLKPRLSHSWKFPELSVFSVSG
jgi:hypothetical protein